MNMFEEIEKIREDLPKFKSITKEVSNVSLNGYQLFAVISYAVCIFLGIILGNLFPSCGSSSNFYSTCTTTEFNFSLMLFFWFISFLVCLFFYGMRHIISLLSEINKKLGKK